MAQVELMHGGGRRGVGARASFPTGIFATVDEADLPAVRRYPWRAMLNRRKGGRVYAVTKVGTKTVLLHRYIMGVTDRRQQVDHRDLNPLNNSRENLRICDNARNHWNLPKIRHHRGAPPVSRFKGVSTADSKRNPWKATVRRFGVVKHLGVFPTEEAAARAYDAAALEHFGEFARPNFPMATA